MDSFSRDLWESMARLHEAPHLKAAWHEALCELTVAIPCAQGVLSERLDGDARIAPTMVVGNDADFVGDYARQYHRLDPLPALAGAQPLPSPARAVLTDELLPAPALRRSGFYRRFLVRYGKLCHGLGGRIAESDQASSHVWLLRPVGQPFAEAERATVSVFMSHARAAFTQRWRLSRATGERDAALAWLDSAEDATFVLDAAGRVLISNLAAERLLRAEPRFSRSSAGLRFGRAAGDDWIVTMLQTVIADSERSRALSASCRRIEGRAGQGDLLAVMASLPAGRAAFPGTARAVLTLRDPQRSRPHLGPDQLKALFGFTLAESRVANALLAGHSVPDIARTWMVRADSISAHVKHMLAKTGSRRQSELLVLLATALPNLRGFNSEA
jgi:DNA-binding CsgD family transcriptional regulator/PAS domain-containing protein